MEKKEQFTEREHNRQSFDKGLIEVQNLRGPAGVMQAIRFV